MENEMKKEPISAEMTEKEKERAYQRAVELLSSSLTNDELIEESLEVLKSLGNYKHAETLYNKYSAQRRETLERTEELAKKRRTSRVLQGIITAIGGVLVIGLVILLVYLLKLDIVR